jgi:menaquinone-dependent protoporphyrinogen oxidase
LYSVARARRGSGYHRGMAKILIAYWTTDGHTRRICERLRGIVEQRGHQVTLASLADGEDPDPAAFDRVVVGASIRYGKHSPVVVDYIARRQAALESRPNAFFSVNVVARKPGKDRAETNPYLRKFLARIRWKPASLDVFAGRIDYPSLGWADRTAIRFIMWMTKGPTDPTGTFEFTDWNRVDEFGKVVAEGL